MPKSVVPTGGFRIDGALGLGAGWDSNALRVDPSARQPHAGVVRLAPRLRAYIPEPGAIGLDLGAGALIQLYEPSPQDLTVSAASAVDLDLALIIGPKAQVSVVAYDWMRRDFQAEDAALIRPAPHVRNTAGILLRWRATHGLRLEAGYELGVARFDTRTEADTTGHEGQLQLAWTFAKAGETWLRVAAGVHDFDDPRPGTEASLAPTRAVFGIAGYMNAALLGLLEVGYGDSLSEPGPRYQSVIGRAALIWRFSETAYFGFGYARDFHPSSWAGQYRTDRVYLRGGFRAGARVGLSFETDYTFIQHGPRPAVDSLEFVSHEARDGQRVRASADITVELLSWLRAKARWDIGFLHSSFRVQRLETSGLAYASTLMVWRYLRQRATLDLEVSF